MANISRIINFLKLNNYHSHFAVELLLLTIMVAVAGGNLALKATLKRATASDQSVLFSFVQNRPALNPRLYESTATVQESLAQGFTVEKQVLAATAKADTGHAAPLIALPTLSGSALLKPNPSGGLPGSYGRDIEVYTVLGGDTIAAIAAAFNVNERTIIDENNLSRAGLIKPGQELRILPVSGVKHIIKDGETLGGISKKYGVDMETIIEFNNIEIVEHIFPGEEIIIPNGIKPVPTTPERRQYLADLSKEDYQKAAIPENYQGAGGGFIWPLPAAHRLSQKFWSRHRAIDVPCRDCQVVASADGIVEIAGWQTGYGYTILLNHGNDMRTRYGHASKLLVSAGDHVTVGQAIMVSGSTGRSTGPHLHFEIKQGGTFLDPLQYLER